MNERQLISDLLSALEYHTEQTRPIEFSRVAIEAAREYLRKPAQQQEPVITKNEKGLTLHVGWDDLPAGTKLYTSPQSKPWVGLTSDEIAALKTLHGANRERTAIEMAFAVQAKLMEKNT